MIGDMHFGSLSCDHHKRIMAGQCQTSWREMEHRRCDRHHHYGNIFRSAQLAHTWPLHRMRSCEPERVTIETCTMNLAHSCTELSYTSARLLFHSFEYV